MKCMVAIAQTLGVNTFVTAVLTADYIQGQKTHI